MFRYLRISKSTVVPVNFSYSLTFVSVSITSETTRFTAHAVTTPMSPYTDTFAVVVACALTDVSASAPAGVLKKPRIDVPTVSAIYI